MKLKRQLLLVASTLLTLPVAGWWAALEVEDFLRQAQEQTLTTLADSLARSVVSQAELAQLSFAADGLYVNHIGFPILIDGYKDDWVAWSAYAQRFESRAGQLRMDLLLAQDDTHLYGLIEVVDPSLQRAQPSPTDVAAGDHVVLALTDRRQLRRVQLLPSVPGGLEVRLPDGTQATGLALQGAWRESADGRGYLIEFSLPRTLVGVSLGIAAVDSGQAWRGEPAHLAGTLDVAGNGPLLRTLHSRSMLATRWLERLAPPDTRLWLVNQRGWVLAAAGRLPLAADSSQPKWWQGLTYRLLTGATLSTPQRRDPAIDLRLSGTEIAAAAAGRTGIRWEPASEVNTVVAAVAVPLVSGVGNPTGALVLERNGDALLITTNRTVGHMLLLSFAVVLVVGGLLLAYASWLSWRVRTLRNAIDSVMDEGRQPDPRLPASKARDEIGDLSRSFSTLLADLGSYNEYLRSLAGKLSHELNTPLAVVRSSLENLQHEGLPATAAPYATRALDGAERLQSILRAMSAAHRLEQAVETSDLDIFDMGELVAGCFDSYRALDPGHRWQLHSPQCALPMLGNPELLAQMIDKLVDNARGFAPLGSEISLSVERHKQWCRLRVGNDGPLLPDELQARLFESLVSVREPGGEQIHLGLGLHMVRLIARAHRGRVQAMNRSDGSGVVFTVAIPLSIDR